MFNENPAVKHIEALKQLNDEFSLYDDVFKVHQLIFDTNHINYWLIKKDEESIYIKPNGLIGFSVKRKTKKMDDVVELIMVTNDYSKKFRIGDLYRLIQESFGLIPIIDESDISKADSERFFKLNSKLLPYINLSPDLMLDVHPKKMHAITLADLMYSTTGRLILQLKDNQQAVTDIDKLMQEYDEINKKDQFEKKKFYVLLDGLEKIANKYI
ncbi:hypothetical protein [Peribacillus frigoritolerans]|uniref:hypothetical protein n=1 Tax=Peribacillus frigoritolerans TaxID=450367 RepID=UPI0023DC40ED|nr:hypothetical protein [Peribacillus frigoritolerans]MDF1997585.1 hypothetical protein [Peribacillus frigoritolerans]